MKQLTIIFFSLLACWAFFSCEYKPSGEYFRDLVKPDTTKQIQIKLSPFETQYVITYPVHVTYDLNTFGLGIYNIEFFIDDKSLFKGSEATGLFGFDPAPYGISKKTMTMKVTTKTNTGSLADLTGAEAFVFQKSWELLLDGGKPDQLEITRIYNNEGVLKIEWEPYKRINFQKFILYKNIGSAEADYAKHIVAEITDQNQNSFNDLSYTGGTGIYWVEVQASNQSAFSNKKAFITAPLKLDTIWVRGDSAKFSWRKNPFYKAVNQIKLTSPSYYIYPPIEIYSTQNPNDTSIVAKHLRFGNSLQYTLSTYPVQNIPMDNDNQVLKSDISFGIGKPFPISTNIICSPTENHVFIYSDSQISKIDMFSGTIVSNQQASFFSNWFISSFNGNLITIVNSKLTSFNKSDLHDFKEYDSFATTGYSWFWSQSISSQNTMLGTVLSGVGLFDWNSSRIIFRQENANTFLSPDGKYAFSSDYNIYSAITLYEVSDTGLKIIGKLPPNVYGLKMWIPGENHKLMVLIGYQNVSNAGTAENTIQIIDGQTMNLDIEFKIMPGNYGGIDFQTRQLAIWDVFPNSDDKRKLYIYNYTNGNMEKVINLAPRFDVITIYHSHVLSGDGFTLDYSTL